MIHKKWRATLWRWHRRLGIILILFIIWLSASGILLNHTSDLHLDKQPVHQQFLLGLYGIERPLIQSYQLGEQWVSHSGEHLYVNSTQISPCSSGLLGVGIATTSSPAIIAAACGDEIVLLTEQGELIERINSSYQLPLPLQVLGQCETLKQSLCFKADNRSFTLNVNEVSWAETSQNIIALSSTKPPAALQTALEQNTVSLHWERVILDLHSGRLLGLGPWLMDIVGILLIVLGLSGLGIWLFHKRF
jgi:hypothetical protein